FRVRRATNSATSATPVQRTQTYLRADPVDRLSSRRKGTPWCRPQNPYLATVVTPIYKGPPHAGFVTRDRPRDLDSELPGQQTWPIALSTRTQSNLNDSYGSTVNASGRTLEP